MPTPAVSDLKFVKNVFGGARLEGNAEDGVTIEVVNLTEIPMMRYHSNEAFELATADHGRFSGKMSVSAGDYVRVRARDASGKTSSWVTVRADSLGDDTENAKVALFRIGLDANEDGTVEIEAVNKTRPISEPNAKLAFVNEATGTRTVVTLDELGYFQGTPTLPGKPGDTYSVRATDGVNDTALANEVGKLTVSGGGSNRGTFDLPDPAMHKDECRPDGTPRYSKERYTGPLWGAEGPKCDEVKQGQIGDCYLPSAAAAVAFCRPDIIQNMVRHEGGGKYVVTFREHTWYGTNKKKEIEVDADLWERSYGGPVYGSCLNSRKSDEMHLWWPLIEKAYAVWKGDFNKIGNGGSSSAVMAAMMGKSSMSRTIYEGRDDEIWRLVKEKVDAELPVSFGTDSDARRYSGTGVFKNHSYSCMGYKVEDGTRYVKVRNPWGESEPYPGDGNNDGIFWLPIDKLCKLFVTFYSVG